ncbi:MAG: ParB N-terminal domain-containing protein [Candidatus Peregrinibacteria bacterium]|nr:ParB N-terminal domain-containing protein [Candidatus Peregrinibacteria bacterium]
MKIIKLINIADLKPHEETFPDNLEKVKTKIKQAGFLINPVIVDQESLVILDGHHRVKSLEILGCKKVPSFLVNYSDHQIKVIPRRQNIKVSKELIIKKALSNKTFPYKTSKHLIPNLPKKINISLWKLV